MMNRNKSFKVVMLGENNSCKTSVLTHLLCNKTLKNVSSENGISLMLETIEEKEFIKSSEAIMSNFFKSDAPIPNSARTKPRHMFSQFPLFTYPTKSGRSLTLALKDSSNKNTLQKIEFYDYSGFLACGNASSKAEKREYYELLNKLREANVILFTVDAVSLMEHNHYPNEPMQMLLSLLSSQEERYPQDEKMIIIVPTKIEKYYHRLNKDLAKDKNDYSTLRNITSSVRTSLSPLLDWLGDPDRRARYEVSILPVLTLGNIEFFAYLSNNGTDITLDESGQQYFQYYNSAVLSSGEEFDSNDLPCYDPQFSEYPLTMILSYMVDRISSGKCKRISRGSSFKQKTITELKDKLTSRLTPSLDVYPHAIIQSTIIK